MLIEFSFGNFRSFKDMQTLSFVAAPIVSKNKELDKNNVFALNEKEDLLKTIAIYGANGSGKSNVVLAILEFLHFIADSFQNERKGLGILAYALNEENGKQPTYFQLVFLHKKKKYRYGFEIKNGEVSSEWLFGPAQKSEVYYFKREGNNIKVNKPYFRFKNIKCSCL